MKIDAANSIQQVERNLNNKIEEAKAEINRRHQATREQLNREKAELLEKINLTDGLLNDAESDMKEQILMLAQSQANISVTVAELRAGTEL